MKKIVFLFMAFAIVASSFSQVKVGDLAPDFELVNTNFEKVSLADYDSQEGVILIFTCNHCPYAKFYEERVNELHRNYESQGFPVVAINPNDSVKYETDGFSFMIKKGYEFPYLLDNKSVYKAYGATKTPHAFLLQKTDSGFKVAYIGAIDDSPQDASAVKEKYIENAVMAIKAGKNVKPTLTKAIGCGIKPFQ